MLGMGFTEIFFVLLIAVIFLGPEKLPTAMVDVMKAFKKAKKFINETSETLSKELEIEELKKDALEYKERLEYTKKTIQENLTQEYVGISDEIENMKNEANKSLTKLNDEIEPEIEKVENKNV